MIGTRLPLFACLALALAAPAMAGPIYKWVDDKGVTHYGEKAPDKAKTSTVNVGDTTSSDADTEIQQLNERRAAASKKSKSEQDTAAPVDDKAHDKAACEMHRKNLAVLKSGKLVRAMGDDGKPRALSDDDVAKQIKFAEDELRRCEEAHALHDGVNQSPAAPAAR